MRCSKAQRLRQKAQYWHGLRRGKDGSFFSSVISPKSAMLHVTSACMEAWNPAHSQYVTYLLIALFFSNSSLTMKTNAQFPPSPPPSCMKAKWWCNILFFAASMSIFGRSDGNGAYIAFCWDCCESYSTPGVDWRRNTYIRPFCTHSQHTNHGRVSKKNQKKPPNWCMPPISAGEWYPDEDRRRDN